MRFFKYNYVDEKLNTVIGRFKYNFGFKTIGEKIFVSIISSLLFITGILCIIWGDHIFALIVGLFYIDYGIIFWLLNLATY